MDLSIIIPAYNEGNKIEADIASAAEFINVSDLIGEIIVVDDGSSDDTAQVARNTMDKINSGVKVKVIRYEENQGKGYAVKDGIKESQGDFVAFADCGCCVPYQYLLQGIDIIRDDQSNIDIAHASRKLNKSTIIENQNLYRRICSKLFKWFLLKIMGICNDYTDTQCGFKVYRGQTARQLYSHCVTNGFMFDIEIILRAQKDGYQIKEFPIEWRCDPDSRLSPAKQLWKILHELIQIKRALADE